MSVELLRSIAASSRGVELVSLPRSRNYDPNFRTLKNVFSAVSSGSENTTASNKNYRALFTGANIKRGLSLAQTPLQFLEKFINFHLTYSSTGYSCLAYDIENNEYFACIGQYASHSEYLHVPIPLAYKVNLDAATDKRCFALVGILAIAVNAVRSATNHCESKNPFALVIGGGILGTLSALYLQSLGYKVSAADTNPMCLAYKLCFSPPEKNELCSVIIDATGSASALGQYLRYISSYAGICLLGDSQFPPLKSELEALNVILTFANSFGSDRGDLNYELYGTGDSLIPRYRTIKSNVEEAISIIKAGHIDALIPNIINPVQQGYFKPNSSAVNIIDWSDL